MANGADWKNSQNQALLSNSPTKKPASAHGANCSKTKKYAQLQSSVFGGGYADGAAPQFDREAGKAGFGTSADWKTSAAMQKPMNKGPSKTDTFL